MAKPARHANPTQILSPSRTFFVTTKTAMGRALLQSERNATLLIDVLRSYVAAGKFYLHDFVVMPDHVHLILKPMDSLTLSRIMKGIKGVSANRLNQLRHRSGAFWQAESFDRILRNEQEFEEKLQYMLDNPVKAGLAATGWEYDGWYFNPDFN